VRMQLESEHNLPILRAQLRNAAGELVDSDVNLGERISAQDGQLVFGLLSFNPLKFILNLHDILA
jgi:hypothetical protein